MDRQKGGQMKSIFLWIIKKLLAFVLPEYHLRHRPKKKEKP